MMIASRQAVVDYMTPLGLAHQMGDRPPLRPRPVGLRPRPARVEPVLLQPRRRGRDRLRPHRERQRCAGAICAFGRRAMARSGGDGRGLPAVVPPPAVGLSARRPAGTLWDELVHALRPRRRARSMRWRGPGTLAAAIRRSRALRRHRRLLRIQQQEARWWRDASLAYWQSRQRLAAARRHAARPGTTSPGTRRWRFPRHRGNEHARRKSFCRAPRARPKSARHDARERPTPAARRGPDGTRARRQSPTSRAQAQLFADDRQPRDQRRAQRARGDTRRRCWRRSASSTTRPTAPRAAWPAPTRCGSRCSIANPSASYLSEFLMGALEQASRSDVHLVVERCEFENDEFAVRQAAGRRRASTASCCRRRCATSSALLDLLTRARRAARSRSGPGAGPSTIRAVMIDDYQAAYDMTEHIIALGHERIGFIIGNPHQTASEQRLDGYPRRDGRRRARSPAPSCIAQGLFTYRSGLDAAERLLSQPDPPTAIFASNDDMAAATVAVAHRRTSTCRATSRSAASTIPRSPARSGPN